MTPEERSAWIRQWPATVVWSRVRDRRDARGRGALDVDSGTAEATTDGLAQLRRKWLGTGGRTSERDARIAAIIEAAHRFGVGATRDGIAAELGRLDEWGEPRSDFKRDVKAAGGWAEIRKRAGL